MHAWGTGVLRGLSTYLHPYVDDTTTTAASVALVTAVSMVPAPQEAAIRFAAQNERTPSAYSKTLAFEKKKPAAAKLGAIAPGPRAASRTEPRNTRSPATPAVHLRQARHHRSSRRSLHGACAPPSWAVCRAWVLEVATTPSPFPTRQPPLLATTPSRSLAASSLESSFQRSATREHSHSRPESGRRRRRKPPRAPPPGGLAGFGCASGAHVLRPREG